LIPVYNGSQTIEAAIRSCLNQTYEHFELLIYNDGSTDNTHQVIQQISDTRIIYLNSNINQGIAYSRNLLLKQSKGDFIAWLDADDEMLKDRLEKQLAFFEKNPSVDICGSWMYLKNKQDNSIILAKTICNSTLLKTALWFKNYMFQPTVMSRNFYVRENIFYQSEYDYLEDYQLWLTLLNSKVFANIPVALVNYGASISEIDAKKNKFNFKQKQIELFQQKAEKHFGLLSNEEHDILKEFIYKNWKLNPAEIILLKSVFKKLKTELNSNWSLRLLLSYYSLRLWRNMPNQYKLINIKLLLELRNYPQMKHYFLV
jgi:glycosyltransferase involved in cell wall biosynthesis